MTNISSDSVAVGGFADDQLAEWLGNGKSAAIETLSQYLRLSQMGEMMVQNLHGTRVPMLSREGSSWVVTNTQGTAITGQNVSAFGATTPALVLVNNNAAGSGIYIYPKSFSFTLSAVGTSSTNWLSRWLVDTGNRYTSGGSALTPTNPNLNVTATKTGALFYFGAITAPAANASRTVNLKQLRGVIPVIQDEVTFDFGNSVVMAPGQAEDGTAVLRQVVALPPIALAPQQSLLWYEWGASQAAARTFDNLQFEYVER
jgi:hypothetical protein